MSENVKALGCAEFAEIVHDLDRPGTAGMKSREDALKHAETCAHCAGLLADAEILDLSLQALAADAESWHAPARVEAVLLQEFRRVRLVSDQGKIRRRIASLGVAAAILLALGISLRHIPNGSASSESTGAALVRSIASDESESETASSAADAAEYATNYVPLPYSDDPQTIEGGAIVRVMLTRPALAAMGLPVTELGATDQIPADIILSEDGAPQAIRLLPEGTAQ